MSTSRTLLTADDLLRLSSLTMGAKKLELVKGELLAMRPAGGRHGRVAIRIGHRLDAYVEANDLGEVFAAETGFRIARDPDTVRAPDAAFIAKGRLPAGELPEGFLDIVPDLVVEVVSPNDTASYVQTKVEEWLRAGVRLVWVLYPDTRSVAVFSGLRNVRVLTQADQLDGGDALPGFTCHVRDLF